jgi:YfiH family protein
MEWLTAGLLDELPFLGHAFLTRNGGCSSGAYASLNCSPWVGDDGAAVDHNLEAIRQQFDLNQLHIMHQVHGSSIVCADGRSSPILGECDGCWTRESKRGLLVLHADCQPILLVDGQGSAIMAIHAGWRGLMKGILPGALREFARIGCLLDHTYMAIGPSLGPTSAEFRHFREEFPDWAWKYRVQADYFDLCRIAQDQAIELGVHPSRIQTIGIDTYQDTRFFSYRRSPTCGRNGSIIWMR